MKKKWFGLYGWFSFCSAHGGGYEVTCPVCNAGAWVFMPKYYLLKIWIIITKKL